MKVEASDKDPSSSVFHMEGFISDSSYVAKKITMVLFINGMTYSCNAISIQETSNIKIIKFGRYNFVELHCIKLGQIW